jgi:hypothetical protein
MSARVCLVLAIVCFILAQVLASGPLLRLRGEVVANGDVLGALPPGEFAGTLMLGGFRGTACDLRWMRAQNAKDAGRYYESVAMAQAIVRVQPHFDQIWEFLAHDMSYNIAAESEDPEVRWEWFLAGLEVNLQGCRRNPHSDRLLRHLAFLFHHKGDEHRDRIARRSWAASLNPLLAPINAQLPEGQRIAVLPEQPGLGNFRISEILYEATVRLCETRGVRVRPIDRSLVVAGIEKDGNQSRNRGEHLVALRRYLAALKYWDGVRAWALSPTADEHEAEQRRIHGAIAEQNQGRMRRKAQILAEQLTRDEELKTRAVALIGAGRWDEATTLLNDARWLPTSPQVRMRWLDEP